MQGQALPGFRDFYPEELALRNHIFATWRAVARRYGFQEYDGPPLEPLELYTAKSGDEIVGQLYEFTDKGDRKIALRPEMTPTLARMVGARAQALKKPIRWFSIPQLFRYERQQRGRLREHFQLNMDILGEAGPLADAELVAAAIDIMRAFGLGPADVKVRLSDRRVAGGAGRRSPHSPGSGGSRPSRRPSAPCREGGRPGSPCARWSRRCRRWGWATSSQWISRSCAGSPTTPGSCSSCSTRGRRCGRSAVVAATTACSRHSRASISPASDSAWGTSSSGSSCGRASCRSRRRVNSTPFSWRWVGTTWPRCSSSRTSCATGGWQSSTGCAMRRSASSWSSPRRGGRPAR